VKLVHLFGFIIKETETFYFGLYKS